MSGPAEQTPHEEILATLKNLEARISRLEAHLDIPAEVDEQPAAPAVSDEEREEALELQIGQNWFAKAGIVGIAAGIAFLLTFPYSNIPPIIPSLVGYVLVGAIVGLSLLWKKDFDQISRYLLGGGLILLYFTTLRLAYFAPVPALADRTIEVSLLSIVVAVNLTISLRRASPYLTSISLLLGCATALIAHQPYVTLSLLALLAFVSAYAFVRFQWKTVLFIGMILVYFSHLVLAMNNPIAGNPLAFIGGPEPSNLFLLTYVIAFGFGALRGLKDREETIGHAFAAVLNGGFALCILFAATSTGQHSDVALWHVALSAVALSIAGGFWRFRRSKYSTFVYAMVGYVALSVAIVAAFARPDFFVWLCWESVLVLVTAVWFRSRFIVVANFVIFLVAFIAYLASAGTVSIVSLSFGVAALLSARILNWQKDRLELHTEMMRNAYLGSALCVIPYALYHSIPSGFVSLSWLLVALTYYAISRVLKLRKYRWMAILTILMTIVYVFVIDLVGLDPTFRIVSFLVLGTALLAVSMIYTRRKATPVRTDTASLTQKV
jgi:uncharacterized membrane protein